MFGGARCWPLSWCLPIPRPTSSLLQMDSPTNPFSSLSLLSDRNPSSFFLFFHFFCLLVVPSFLQRKGEKWRTWHWPYLPTFCAHKKIEKQSLSIWEIGLTRWVESCIATKGQKNPLSPYFSLENHEWETLNKRYRIEREKYTPFFLLIRKKGKWMDSDSFISYYYTLIPSLFLCGFWPWPICISLILSYSFLSFFLHSHRFAMYTVLYGHQRNKETKKTRIWIRIFKKMISEECKILKRQQYYRQVRCKLFSKELRTSAIRSRTSVPATKNIRPAFRPFLFPLLSIYSPPIFRLSS